MTREELMIRYESEEMTFLDGHDDAIMGIEIPSMRVIYSVSKIVFKLAEESNLNDAIDFFEYNIADAYVGDKTPIWCYDNF